MYIYYEPQEGKAVIEEESGDESETRSVRLEKCINCFTLCSGFTLSSPVCHNILLIFFDSPLLPLSPQNKEPNEFQLDCVR